MPTWKKVLVSGSAMEVTNVTASVAVSVGSNQIITTSPASTVLSGSFSGSFSGSGAGLTGVQASTLANSLTQGTGITAFSFNGNSGQTVSVSGASSLNTNAITKWNGNAFVNSSLNDNGTVISGSTSIQLTGANSIITGSFSGSVTGYVPNSQTGSFILSANTSSMTVGTATNAVSTSITNTQTSAATHYITFVDGTTEIGRAHV